MTSIAPLGTQFRQLIDDTRDLAGKKQRRGKRESKGTNHFSQLIFFPFCGFVFIFVVSPGLSSFIHIIRVNLRLSIGYVPCQLLYKYVIPKIRDSGFALVDFFLDAGYDLTRRLDLVLQVAKLRLAFF